MRVEGWRREDRRVNLLAQGGKEGDEEGWGLGGFFFYDNLNATPNLWGLGLRV